MGRGITQGSPCPPPPSCAGRGQNRARAESITPGGRTPAHPSAAAGAAAPPQPPAPPGAHGCALGGPEAALPARLLPRPGPAMGPGGRALCALLCLLRAGRAGGAELTFELPDSARHCFHEPLQRGLRFTLDFQVITGGHYDVDCSVEDPAGKTLYTGAKKQYDSFSHRAALAGVYTFCFSNAFSTFSHKTVYFDFHVGDEPPLLPDMAHRVTALTQMESACVTIHEALSAVIDSQTHYRLREAQDRLRAEELNSHVSYWSVGETVLLLVVSVSQVMLLKSFFTETRATAGVLST